MGAAESKGSRRTPCDGIRNPRMKTRALILAFTLLPLLLRGATFTIQNETLRVDYDDATGVSITHLADRKTFVRNESFWIEGGGPSTIATQMGQGFSIANGKQSVAFELSPGAPFVLIRRTLQNTESQAEEIDRVSVATFTPHLDGVPSKLVIRGTGGLRGVEEYAPQTRSWWAAIWDKIMRRHYHQPGGSYEWLTVADPQTRAGIVAGFLGHSWSTGVLTPSLEADDLKLEVHSEFGHLLFKPGKVAETETLALGYFDDVRLGLEAYANEVARNSQVHLPPQPAGFTTWYMEKNGGAADEHSLATLSGFIAKNLKPYGMNFLQIDDRWQAGQDTGNGPDKNFTASNPKGPYPTGMKTTADKIRSDGLTPGLWFLPFSGDYKDPWFADKQGFFVRTKNGQPYHTGWGGTSLDMTNPAAQGYLQGIVTNIVHNWGFSYLKIDGLYTGLAAQNIYISSDYNPADGFGDGVFANPDKTNIEAFRDGLKLVRTAAGPGTFILGCNTAQNMRVFGASMGLVDAMRIGPDNARILTGSDDGNAGPPQIEVNWNTWRDASPLYGSREYFLNGRLWYNDPDPNYVRASLTLDEARTEASWTAISGQLFTSSDWLPDLPAERLDIIKRTITPHGGIARPVDFLDNDPPRIWQLTDGTGDTRRDIVALFNFDDTPQTISVPLSQIDLPKADSYAAFDFWANAFLPPIKNAISATLPPHACQVLAVRPMLDHPFVLSTSRHVTQGIIDLTNEKWNPATRTLSGTSDVIAGDPYELRIAAPGPPGTWTIKSCKVGLAICGEPDPGSGWIEPNIMPAEGGSLRATITNSIDAPVLWEIAFK